MFKIQFQVEGGGQLREAGNLLAGVSDPTDHLAESFKELPEIWGEAAHAGLDVWSQFIDRVFESEHDGRWANLRKRTVAERTWIAQNVPMALVDNFSAAHPILQRAGHLRRSLTDSTFGPQTIVDYHQGGPEQHATGARIVWDRTLFGDFSVHWATHDDRFLSLQTGRGVANMPARPMVPDASFAFSPDAQPLFEELEKIFVSFFERLFDA